MLPIASVSSLIAFRVPARFRALRGTVYTEPSPRVTRLEAVTPPRAPWELRRPKVAVGAQLAPLPGVEAVVDDAAFRPVELAQERFLAFVCPIRNEARRDLDP